MAYVFDRRISIRDKDSFEILPLATYTAGTKLIKVDFQGNSLLSTLFVRSITSGTVTVNYFDFTTSSGDTTERYDLQGHTTPTPGVLPDRILVTQLHNKAVCEVLLTGTAEIGIYGTIVDFSASDIDSSLVKEGQAVTLALDKGIIQAYYNPVTGTYHFGRIDSDGNICVKTTDTIGSGYTNQIFSDSRTSNPGTEETHISETVPASTNRFLEKVIVTNRHDSKFTISRGATIIGSGRTGPANINAVYEFRKPFKCVATDLVTVKFEACDWAPAAAVETYLHATDVSV